MIIERTRHLTCCQFLEVRRITRRPPETYDRQSGLLSIILLLIVSNVIIIYLKLILGRSETIEIHKFQPCVTSIIIIINIVVMKYVVLGLIN